jgi:hypothetical protein
MNFKISLMALIPICLVLCLIQLIPAESIPESFLTSYENQKFIFIPFSNSYFPIFSEAIIWLYTYPILSLLLIAAISSLTFFLSSNGPVLKTLAAVLLPIILILLFGIDVFHLTLSFSLLLALLGLKLINYDNKIFGLATLTISILILCLIYPAAGFLLTIFLLPFLVSYNYPQYGFALFWIFICCTFFYFLQPIPVLPDYPLLSTLVPDYPAGSYRPLPLIADSPTVSFINRPGEFIAFRRIVFYYSLILLALNIINPSKYAFALIIPIAALLWDLYPDDHFTDLSPLQSLRRVIPGLYILAPLSIIFVFTITSCAALLKGPKGIVCLVAALFLSIIFPFISITPGKLTKIEHKALIKEAINLQDAERNKILSPSFYIYQKFGPLLVSQANDLVDWIQASKIDHLKVTSIAGAPPRGYKRIISGNPNTRYPVTVNGQLGGEWICFEFNEEKIINRVLLETGSFTNEYPRGLSIYLLDHECPVKDINMDKLTPTVSFHPWSGPLRLTNTNTALPYLGDKNNVEIIFPQNSNTRAILFLQTENSPYNWSISGIKFALQ